MNTGISDQEDLTNEFIIGGIMKQAYKVFDGMNETIWLEMLRSRSDMSHIYDGNAARNLVNSIITSYIPEFLRLQKSKLFLNFTTLEKCYAFFSLTNGCYAAYQWWLGPPLIQECCPPLNASRLKRGTFLHWLY